MAEPRDRRGRESGKIHTFGVCLLLWLFASSQAGKQADRRSRGGRKWIRMKCFPCDHNIMTWFVVRFRSFCTHRPATRIDLWVVVYRAEITWCKTCLPKRKYTLQNIFTHVLRLIPFKIFLLDIGRYSIGFTPDGSQNRLNCPEVDGGQ